MDGKRFVSYLRAQDRRPVTIRGYVGLLERLETDISDIQDLAKVNDWLLNEAVPQSTRSATWYALKAYWDMLDIPTKKLVKVLYNSRTRKNYPPSKIADLIIRSFTHEESKLVVKIIRQNGMRVSLAYQFELPWVDPRPVIAPAGTRFYAVKVPEELEGNKARYFEFITVITEDLYEELKAFAQRTGRLTGRLFLFEGHAFPRVKIYDETERACKAAGVQMYSPQLFRHLVNNEWDELDIPVEDRTFMLGQKSINTNIVSYTHKKKRLLIGRLGEAMEQG